VEFVFYNFTRRMHLKTARGLYSGALSSRKKTFLTIKTDGITGFNRESGKHTAIDILFPVL